MEHNVSRNHSAQNMVDHLLLLFIIICFLTGQILDHALEHSLHGDNNFWLYTHIASASAFTILSLIHFKHHWGWFRTLPEKLNARKKDTLFLLPALIVLIVSGILVTVNKTHISGFTHALSGFLCTIVGIYHFYVRHIRRKRQLQKRTRASNPSSMVR